MEISLPVALAASLSAGNDRANNSMVAWPLLREELRLIPAANNPDGSPAWMIQDPIVNRFYRIGWMEFEILLRWEMADGQAIVDDILASTPLQVGDEDVEEFRRFLIWHHLIRTDTREAVNELLQQRQAKKQSVWNWLLHHYLFFRIPLVKPQRWLDKALPWFSGLFSWEAAAVVSVLTLLGVFLALRQWEVFTHTFVDHMTLGGLASYGLALVFSKFVHELGHALTAVRHGVRVAHMGVAMLVMAPMPYTDTSESWKLVDPSKRRHIAQAGIVAELALAGIATLLWSLCPEGGVKNGLFFLATTGWILTLAVNLSPFMRFDGYFILSDLLDFPNLHERSGALAITFFRRTLLGWSEPWPEDFSLRKRIGLIVFSCVTWVYRISVFLGIAWLVYVFFFKVLGIFLLAVELGWFVFLPIAREMKVWWQRRAEIARNRRNMGFALLVMLIVSGLIPWERHIQADGWIHAERQSIVFTPIAGRLVSSHAEGAVVAGEKLFELTSPDIAWEAERARALADARGEELRGLSGLPDGESKRATLEQQQAGHQAEEKLYKDELNRMSIPAAFSGVLQDLDIDLSIGGWVHPKQPMAILLDPESWVAEAFVEEQDVSRLAVGGLANIYPRQSSMQKLTGRIVSIESARLESLPNELLAATHGGPFSTLEGLKGRLSPKLNLYRVRVQLDQRPALGRVTAADFRLDATGRAWLAQLLRGAAATVIRESGF